MVGCKHCGNCCKYNIFEPWQFKYDMEWLAARGGRISGRFALVPSICQKLVGNDCSIYENRPAFCRDWPGRLEDCTPGWLEAMGCRFFEEDGDGN